MRVGQKTIRLRVGCTEASGGLNEDGAASHHEVYIRMDFKGNQAHSLLRFFSGPYAMGSLLLV